ncbi:hypothetical protein R1flu_008546 [Riccia fluitans]|uniref:Uncharacterized protein n=1 Tax=Riccia fluitans TaxID=41844 RepID=A0ABD1YCA4_9MARC
MARRGEDDRDRLNSPSIQPNALNGFVDSIRRRRGRRVAEQAIRQLPCFWPSLVREGKNVSSLRARWQEVEQ